MQLFSKLACVCTVKYMPCIYILDDGVGRESTRKRQPYDCGTLQNQIVTHFQNAASLGIVLIKDILLSKCKIGSLLLRMISVAIIHISILPHWFVEYIM